MTVYGYVTLVTVIMVMIMFISRGIYPFGDRDLRYTDGAQYFGMLSYLQRTFFTSDDLLYSWSQVLGGPMISTYAYYAASPFNVLAVLFRDNLMAGYNFIFALKFLAAALCFAVMLCHMFQQPNAKAVVLFASSYPFIGYMTFYAWNQSWMDGVVLLPLVTLGIWNIIQQKTPWMYTFSLALMLFSNCYVGYMICVASILLFLCGMAIMEHASKKQVVRTIGCYAAASTASFALAAVLLLPTAYALPKSRINNAADLVEGAAYITKPEEILSMLYTGPINNMGWFDNYPVIFAGIPQFVLAVLFFLNRRIPTKYKVIAGVLLGVFGVSFSIRAVNIAWHGFTSNIGYNFRYSFLVSFILELVSYYSFIRLCSAKKRILAAGLIVAGITALAMTTPKNNVDGSTLVWDIIWTCATLCLLYAYSNGVISGKHRDAMLCYLVIAGITFVNLAQNSFLSLRGLGFMSEYLDTVEVDNTIQQIVNDDSMYRLGSTRRFGRADAMRMGYAGVENFSSTENHDVIEFSNRVGIATTDNRARADYDINVPLSTDALLGIKYVVTDNTRKTSYYSDKGHVADTGLNVYQNDHALPVIFPAETKFDNAGTGLNKFDYINGIWNSIIPAYGDVLEEVHYTIENAAADDGLDIVVRFNAPVDGPIYVFAPKCGDLETSLPITEFHFQDVFYVGDFKRGQQGEIMMRAPQSYDGVDRIAVYQENSNILSDKANQVLLEAAEVKKLSSSHLYLEIQLDNDCLLASTIPFDEGWHVYIDGIETDIFRNMDVFLAFDAPAGEHTIELKYWPPYLTLGIWVTSITMVCIVSIVVLRRRRINGGEKSRQSMSAAL